MMPFPQQFSHRSRTLPPIESLINQRRPCSNDIYGCKRQFDNYDDFLQHQQTCNHALGQTFASDESDSSSTIYTPGTSRAPSPVTRIPDRRSSQVTNRITKRISRRASSPPSGEVDRRVKKTEKEKMNRSNIAAVLSRLEDVLAYYVGWERHEQSGGNGNAAGLQTNKINLLKGEEAIFCHLLHKAFCRAVQEGNLEQLQAELQQVANDALEDGYEPHSGTFLYSDEEPCAHVDTKSKQCVTHGTADWRECRKEKSSGTFLRNVAGWCQQVGVAFPQSLLQMGGSVVSKARTWFPCVRPRQG